MSHRRQRTRAQPQLNPSVVVRNVVAQRVLTIGGVHDNFVFCNVRTGVHASGHRLTPQVPYVLTSWRVGDDRGVTVHLEVPQALVQTCSESVTIQNTYQSQNHNTCTTKHMLLPQVLNPWRRYERFMVRKFLCVFMLHVIPRRLRCAVG